jgi:hypothetical protein
VKSPGFTIKRYAGGHQIAGGQVVIVGRDKRDAIGVIQSRLLAVNLKNRLYPKLVIPFAFSYTEIDPARWATATHSVLPDREKETSCG